MKCSFCDKDSAMVNTMIAGPGVNICNFCVRIAHDVVIDNYEQKNKELNKVWVDENMMLRVIRDEILHT